MCKHLTSRLQHLTRRWLCAADSHMRVRGRATIPSLHHIVGRRLALVLAFLAGAAVLMMGQGRVAKERPNTFQRRYVLVFADLNRPADLDKVLSIMRRAASVGYNGLVLGPVGPAYLRLARATPTKISSEAFAAIRKEADRLHFALIPYALGPGEVGYLAPELAEAIPCYDTYFRVRGNSAEVEPSSSPLLANGGFERFQGNAIEKWSQDKPGTITFVDTDVRHSGNASVRIQDPGKGDGLGRLIQEVQVTPFRAYEFSVWIKTLALTDPTKPKFYFNGRDGQHPVLYSNQHAGLGSPLSSTQDWTRYTVWFNSASNSRVGIYFGIWSPQTMGTTWFDDAEMHEVGLVNTVRRATLPVTVRSSDGSITYEEGRDYLVNTENLGIPANSHIPEGAGLKVSWFQRADMLGPLFGNATDPQYWAIEEAIASQLDALLSHPTGFMMTYDEWRIANWDPAAGEITAGEYVAQTVRRTIELLRRINPRYSIYVWSDMFDPNANAVSDYFLCNGPLTGSWDGLTQDTTVVTWTGGAKALRFFSDLQIRQLIGGYYSSLGNVKEWLDAVDAVEVQGARGIDGFLYTTWDENYRDLETVAEMIRARGRWGRGRAIY